MRTPISRKLYCIYLIILGLSKAHAGNDKKEPTDIGRKLFIRPLSDLHCEHNAFRYKYQGEHVIVLAGDINKGTKGIEWAKKLDIKSHDLDDVHICYVAGNHEYFGSNIDKTDKLLKGKSTKNVHYLNNSDIKINGVNFLGTTLWTDMEGMQDKDESIKASLETVADYKNIYQSSGGQFINPRNTIYLHNKSVKWLDKRLNELKGEPNVIITHHAPSKRSVAAKYSTQSISAAFFSKLDHLITKYQPRLWIHGHTHNKSDYKIGKTRVICNPRGYADELEESGFNSEKVIFLNYTLPANSTQRAVKC